MANQPLDIDDIDRTLIAALIADGRASYAQLAPLVDLAQPTVRKRVQRLLDESIIVVAGRVDPAALGLGVFAFAFVKVAGPVEDAARLIVKLDEVAFATVSTGRCDVLVELRCRDDGHVVSALDQIRAIPEVAGVESATVLGLDKQDWTRVGESTPAEWAQPVGPASGRLIDEVDRRLLDELARDGRASYASLGPTVGLSGAAVRERVLSLLDDGVVTVQAQPVPEAMGIAGFCGIAVKAVGPIRPAAEAACSIAEVTLVARTLGAFDMTVEVWFRSSDHLSLVLDRVRAVPGIGVTDTVPYLDVVKEEYRLWV